MSKIMIRGEGGDYVTIEMLGRSHPDANDYWDGNWLAAAVTVHAGGFDGAVTGDLRADELSGFLGQLTALQQALSGTADFATMECWLEIHITGNGRGHMQCHCLVLDCPGTGNQLNFAIASDQTFLQQTIVQLATVVREFPVIGSPG